MNTDLSGARQSGTGEQGGLAAVSEKIVGLSRRLVGDKRRTRRGERHGWLEPIPEPEIDGEALDTEMVLARARLRLALEKPLGIATNDDVHRARVAIAVLEDRARIVGAR